MKTELLLQFALLLTVLLVTSSEGFFFEYPKKILTNLLHSLKEKKEAKKRPYHVQHYHVHYYPIPHILYEPPIKAPNKHELNEIYDEHLASLGWSDYEYKYIPEPKIKIPLKVVASWHDSTDWGHEILESDLSELHDLSENEGIVVEVPIDQKIVIEHPHSSKKLKTGLLPTLFHKIKDFKHHKFS